MTESFFIFFLTLATGLAMVIGALIASVENISNSWLENEFRHTVVAFGGGILVAAVSLVLVHEGIKSLTPLYVTLCFSLGGVFFMGLDMLFHSMNVKASQLAAMITDFIPEVMALGALYTLNKPHAILLACLIILQNIPEGFNAYLELRKGNRHKGRTIIIVFFMASFLGPITGLFSYYFLAKFPAVIAGIMLFAAGGILYLVFQDIAPQSKIEQRVGPALGAVGGFLLGLIGKMLIMPIG